MAVIFAWAFLVLFLQGATVDGASNTTFTLYTGTPAMSWDASVKFCRSQGQELFRVTSQDQQDFLGTLDAQPNGLWYNKCQGKHWSGLHDPNATTTETGYQWQLQDPTACLALDAGNWTNWADGRIQANGALCVAFEWVNHVGIQWRASGCDETQQHKVICQQTGGSCAYRELSLQTVRITPEVTTLTLSGTKEQCQEFCSATSTVGRECWAAAWSAAVTVGGVAVGLPLCQLFLSPTPFSETSDLTVHAVSTLLLPSCLDAKLNETTLTASETTSAYNPQCSESGENSPSSGGTGSAAAIVTQWDGHYQQKMTYFAHDVTHTLAKTACAHLASQQNITLVMPKDASTETSVREYLSSSNINRVWLGVQKNTSGLYWQDQSSAALPEGTTALSPDKRCVVGSAGSDEQVHWEPASCTSDLSAFICQQSESVHCTMTKHEDTAILTDWVMTYADHILESCTTYCNTHKRDDKECLAFTLDDTADLCYFSTSLGTQFSNATGFHLYISDGCFTYYSYDNSSAETNAILFSQETVTTPIPAQTSTTGSVSGTTDTAQTSTDAASGSGTTNTEHTSTDAASGSGTTNTEHTSTDAASGSGTTNTEHTSTGASSVSGTTDTEQTSTDAASVSGTTDTVQTSTDAASVSGTTDTVHTSTDAASVSGTTDTEQTSTDAADTASGSGTTNTEQTSTGATQHTGTAAPSSNASCGSCKCMLKTNATVLQAETLAQILTDLSIDATETSQYRRKRVSIPDYRTSAQTIGSFGVIIIVSVFSLFVISDVLTFLCRRGKTVDTFT